MDKLNLASKDSWTKENAEEIASILGFVFNDAFIELLDKFIEEKVASAAVTAFLAIIAKNFLDEKGAEKVN